MQAQVTLGLGVGTQEHKALYTFKVTAKRLNADLSLVFLKLKTLLTTNDSSLA